MQRWTRLAAVITAIGLTTAVFGIAESAASGDRRGGGRRATTHSHRVSSVRRMVRRPSSATLSESSRSRSVSTRATARSPRLRSGLRTIRNSSARSPRSVTSSIPSSRRTRRARSMPSSDRGRSVWTRCVTTTTQSIPIGNPIVSLIIAAALRSCQRGSRSVARLRQSRAVNNRYGAWADSDTGARCGLAREKELPFGRGRVDPTSVIRCSRSMRGWCPGLVSALEHIAFVRHRRQGLRTVFGGCFRWRSACGRSREAGTIVVEVPAAHHWLRVTSAGGAHVAGGGDGPAGRAEGGEEL